MNLFDFTMVVAIDFAFILGLWWLKKDDDAREIKLPFERIQNNRNPDEFDTEYPYGQFWHNTKNNSKWVLESKSYKDSLLAAQWKQIHDGKIILGSKSGGTGITTLKPATFPLKDMVASNKQTPPLKPLKKKASDLDFEFKPEVKEIKKDDQTQAKE